MCTLYPVQNRLLYAVLNMCTLNLVQESLLEYTLHCTPCTLYVYTIPCSEKVTEVHYTLSTVYLTRVSLTLVFRKGCWSVLYILYNVYLLWNTCVYFTLLRKGCWSALFTVHCVHTLHVYTFECTTCIIHVYTIPWWGKGSGVHYKLCTVYSTCNIYRLCTVYTIQFLWKVAGVKYTLYTVYSTSVHYTLFMRGCWTVLCTV